MSSSTVGSKERERLNTATGIPLPPVLDTVREHYPFCVVWTTIPIISWILPFIGHIAICDSLGRKYDFQGNYTIGDDNMIFGNPLRYWDVSKTYIPSFYSRSPPDEDSVKRECDDYDNAIARATRHFRQAERYNFFTNNCHSFVAACLNEQAYTTGRWNMVNVCFAMLFYGRPMSTQRFIKAYTPFFVIVLLLLCLFVLL